MATELYCEHCGSGPECGVCGRGVGQSLPPAYCRWSVRRDVPRIVAVERETFGTWTEDDFLKANRIRNVVTMVADDSEGAGGRVRGFITWKIHEFVLEVLNLAAVDPVARRALLAKLRARATEQRKQILWPAAVC